MLTDAQVRAGLGEGTGVVVAAADATGRPACCRAIALFVDESGSRATVYLPVATSSEVVANLATTGRIAVTSTAPISHASVQLKGRSRGVRLAGDDERPRVEAALERFADVLADLGMPRRLTRSLRHWPAFAVELEVEAVFDQSPGPLAGALLGRR